MTFTDYLLYTVWSLFPLFFLLMALWSQLEKFSDKSNRDDIGDYLRQAGFLTLCVIVSIIIDFYWIETWAALIPIAIPLLYYRLVLFPLVMFLMGRLWGGSAKIEVEKNPLLKFNRRNRR